MERKISYFFHFKELIFSVKIFSNLTIKHKKKMKNIFLPKINFFVCVISIVKKKIKELIERKLASLYHNNN